MLTLVYTVEVDQVDDEKDFLRLQKVTPTINIEYDWEKQRQIARFGMIVGAEAALVIKLRRNLDIQHKYVPR